MRVYTLLMNDPDHHAVIIEAEDMSFSEDGGVIGFTVGGMDGYSTTVAAIPTHKVILITSTIKQPA